MTLATPDMESKINTSNLVNLIKSPQFQHELDKAHREKKKRKLLFWVIATLIIALDGITLVSFFLFDISSYTLGVFALSLLSLAGLIFALNINTSTAPDEVLVFDESTVILIKDDMIKVSVKLKEPVQDVKELASRLNLTPTLIGNYQNKSEPVFVKLTKEQEELVKSEVRQLQQDNNILITPDKTELVRIISTSI